MSFHSLLSLCLLCVLQAEARLEAINISRISPRISETSEGICVSWNKPGMVGRHCYESNLRFRSTCDTEWENLSMKEFFYVIKPDKKKNYEFQIRMRYDHRCYFGVEWTAWTPTISWGNATDKGPCTEEKKEFSKTRLHVLIILSLCACFLLVCTLSHKWVKRWLLPSIPDPQHTLDHLFDMELPQLHVYIEPSGDCELVDIEIVQRGEDEEEVQEEDKKKTEQMNTEAESRHFGQDLSLENNQPYIVYNSLDLVLKSRLAR